MKKIKLLLLGVASMGVSSFAYAANEAAQTPPCFQQPDNQECPKMIGYQGPDGQMMPPPPPQGRFRQGQSGVARNGFGMGRDFCEPMGMNGKGMMIADACPMPFGQNYGRLPQEIKDRIETLRADRKALRELWVQAVVTRGDKPISTVREEFTKANAELISKIEKSDQSIKDDIAAIREGCGQVGDNDGMPFSDRANVGMTRGLRPFFGDDAPFCVDKEVIAKIDADVVASIMMLKKPLTVEEYEKIREDAISKNRQELKNRYNASMLGRRYGMNAGMPMMMPPMDPALARMREEMGHMRGEDFHARREFRAKLKEAMKIKDAAKREAAVKDIFDNMSDQKDSEKAPESSSK